MREPELLKKLRKLTLYSYSGMNHELNTLESIYKIRPVKCEVVLAYHEDKLIGWCLLNKETSTYTFTNHSFRSGDGVLFEIFVDEKYRRQGVGTELIRTARRKTYGNKLCIAPWDYTSEQFYSKFKRYNHKKL
jgi:GNAT superfamily N-acetyltransferase